MLSSTDTSKVKASGMTAEGRRIEARKVLSFMGMVAVPPPYTMLLSEPAMIDLLPNCSMRRVRSHFSCAGHLVVSPRISRGVRSYSPPS
jgi:hypothetical protein